MNALPIIAGSIYADGGIRAHSAVKRFFSLQFLTSLNVCGAERMVVTPSNNATPRQPLDTDAHSKADKMAGTL